VSEFALKPDLETKGWRQRLPLSSLIMSETFGGEGEAPLKALTDRMAADCAPAC
jgi:5,6-dimethylbenzimidazole synthase